MRPSNKKIVLLLDRNFYPVGPISWKRAMGKLYGEELRVETLCDYSDAIGELDPAVIRLVKRAIPSHQMRRRPRLTRRSIFIRDDYECQYCGSTKIKELTIDHVCPRSAGGTHSFDNCTTACLTCNQQKGSLSLKEWGREPKTTPIAPVLGDSINSRKVPKEWVGFIY